MGVRLIKDIVRWRDLIPGVYLEIDEVMVLRAGIEWVPQGTAMLGIEYHRKLSGEAYERFMPVIDRLHGAEVLK